MSKATTNEHGATTITEWLEDLLALARSGRPFKTSGGAEPNRAFAYLEYHRADEDEHSLLVFEVDEQGGEPRVRAHRLDGTGTQVQAAMHRLVHAET